jgi:DNA polymerase elongation subunit (family B)
VTWVKVRDLRVLDFDSECRPLHYSEWRDESQITAIAWGWTDEKRVHHAVLEQDLSNERDMLAAFIKAYREADVVTGHYIVRHDLPLINDHCMRFGWGLLEPKRAQDTKTLLPRVKGLGLSQENLATLYKLDRKKHHMNGRKWAGSNTLTPEGREEAFKRVVSDVEQHKQLRATLIAHGYLKPAVLWRP